MAALGIQRWEIEAFVALALLIAGCLWMSSHDAGIREDAMAAATAPIAAAQAAASAVQTAREAMINIDQKEALDAAQAKIQSGADVVAALRADIQRMRNDAIRASASAQHPAAAASSSPGIDAGADMVPRGLYESALAARAGAESDAADLAIYTAGLRVSGNLCAADYGALRKP